MNKFPLFDSVNTITINIKNKIKKEREKNTLVKNIENISKDIYLFLNLIIKKESENLDKNKLKEIIDNLTKEIVNAFFIENYNIANRFDTNSYGYIYCESLLLLLTTENTDISKTINPFLEKKINEINIQKYRLWYNEYIKKYENNFYTKEEILSKLKDLKQIIQGSIWGGGNKIRNRKKRRRNKEKETK